MEVARELFDVLKDLVSYGEKEKGIFPKSKREKTDKLIDVY